MADLAALEERILILAPTGRDAAVAREVLAQAGFSATVCGSLDEITEECARGASVLLLAEEGLYTQGMPGLLKCISNQPAWSDIPIIILTGSGEPNVTRLQTLNAFSHSANVTFLERPFRQLTLVSTLKMAMRARQRQYQLRGTLSSLGESEERLRLALDSGKIAAWEWNIPANRWMSSARLHDLLGLGDGDTPGGLDTFLERIHPEDLAAFKATIDWALEDARDCEMEFRALRPDGSICWLYCRAKVFRDRKGKPNRMIGAAMDISERKQTEEDLRKGKESLVQAQKMEAIGKLAGGIAHDFNNMLTAINGYSELLLGQLSDREALNIGLTEILRSGRRAAALTNQLLAYSRQQIMEFRVMDLNKTVEGLAGLLHRLIKEDIDHVMRLQSNLPNIKADPTQMDQVVLNLALNARDAMPNGGRLEIETFHLIKGPASPARYAELPDGSYVGLAVRDNGVGMSGEVKNRIFDPFFTTKNLGKGTGMGLATVYGIVQQSGGQILVETEPGRGSVFEVLFPAVAEHASPPEAPTQKTAAHPRCRETILVAEDETSVRVFLRQLLSAQGYTVLSAANGQEALEVASVYPGEIHLLLTDVVMPGMSGRELAEKLGRERPRMRMLFISGYTDDAILQHGVLDGDTAFMNKPFPPASLLEKVRELLSVNPVHGMREGVPKVRQG